MGFSTAEWRDEAKHAWTQVDELRAEIKRLRAELADRETRIHKQCERVEELEKQNDTSNDAFQKLNNFGNKINEHYCEHGEYPHIITTDQIRAAWKLCNIAAEYKDHVGFELLEQLGIVRCEGCGGDGHSMSTFAVKHEQVRMGTCPDCNGKGFKIGGGDE